MWLDPYQAQKQQAMCKHRDFMTFPLDIKGNFLIHQPKPPVYQGNYIDEHQNYVYIQVKLLNSIKVIYVLHIKCVLENGNMFNMYLMVSFCFIFMPSQSK